MVKAQTSTNAHDLLCTFCQAADGQSLQRAFENSNAFGTYRARYFSQKCLGTKYRAKKRVYIGLPPNMYCSLSVECAEFATIYL